MGFGFSPGKNPCPNLGAGLPEDGPGEGDHGPDSGEENPNEGPSLSQEAYAQYLEYNSWFVDPGDDGWIRFNLQHASSFSPTPTVVDVTVKDRLTQEVILEESAVEIPMEPNEYVQFATEHDRSHGMALVSIYTIQGDGNTYFFWPDPAGEPDREQFNIGMRPALTWEGYAKYRFWVPLMAEDLRIDCLTNGDASGFVNLRDPDGIKVWDSRDLGHQHKHEGIPEEKRGAVWELELIPTGPCHGDLVIEFRAHNDTEWRAPLQAFAPFGQYNSTVLADFNIGETPGFAGGAMEYWSPYGSPLIPEVPYEERPSLPCEEVTKLVWVGRQTFTFLSVTEENRTTIHNLYNIIVQVEYQIEPGGDRIYEDIPVGGQLTIPFGGAGAPTRLRLRVMTGSRYDITTDAPYAAAGPTPGLVWGKCDWTSQTLESPSCWFYVPDDLETYQLSMEAKRRCGEGECTDWESYTYRVYPRTLLIVTDPDGNDLPPAIADAGNHGRADLTVDVGDWGGHAWSMRVVVDSDPGPGLNPSRAGLNIGVVLDQDLPPYVTWLEKERLIVPHAFPVSPRMVHTVESPFEFCWRVVPPLDRYFHSTSSCQVESGQCESSGSPTPTLITQVIDPSGNPLKEKYYAALGAWTRTSDIDTDVETLYAIPRAVGLTAAGEVRTSDEGSPGEPKQFVNLWGATYYDPEQCELPLCEDQILEAKSRGYRTIKPNGHISHGNEPHDDVYNLSYYHELHTVTTIGGEQWISPKPPPGGWDQYWEDYEDSARRWADKNGVVAMIVVDEALEKGHGADWLYELVYRQRLWDRRHAILFNEEPEIVSMRELDDIVEILGDEQYLHRSDQSGGDTPACEYVTRVMEVINRRPASVGVAGFQLLGFLEDSEYQTPNTDVFASQTIAGLLLGVDIVNHFARLHGGDVAEENALLWESLPDVLSMADSVAIWLEVLPPYAIGFGDEEETVPQCEFEPITFGYGPWERGVFEGELGRWFALANLAPEDVATMAIYYEELQISEDVWSITDLVIDYQSPDAEVNWIAHAGVVEFRLDPGEWVVGRLIWDHGLSPAAVDDYLGGASRLALSAAPNPFGHQTSIRLVTSEPGNVGFSVYSSSGRLVRNLGRVTVQPGLTPVVWDGKDGTGHQVSSGIYFVRVEDGAGRETMYRLLCVR
jgi:hypothetical protein